VPLSLRVVVEGDTMEEEEEQTGDTLTLFPVVVDLLTLLNA